MSKIKTEKMKLPIMKDEDIDKMSLNAYDQLFIKRCFDREDEYLAEILSSHFDRVYEALADQNAVIQQIAQDIRDIKLRLCKVEQDVSDEDRRITRLEMTQRWWNIAFRIGIAVAISTIITLIIHYNNI